MHGKQCFIVACFYGVEIVIGCFVVAFCAEHSWRGHEEQMLHLQSRQLWVRELRQGIYFSNLKKVLRVEGIDHAGPVSPLSKRNVESRWQTISNIGNPCHFSFGWVCSLQGFEHHVKNEHNMWAYVFFLIHLRSTKANDHTTLESAVFQQVSACFPHGTGPLRGVSTDNKLRIAHRNLFSEQKQGEKSKSWMVWFLQACIKGRKTYKVSSDLWNLPSPPNAISDRFQSYRSQSLDDSEWTYWLDNKGGFGFQFWLTFAE